MPSGYAPRPHHGGPAVRAPGGLGLAWALFPLVTFGLGTWVAIGWAAIRLRSRTLGLATAGYFAGFLLLLVGSQYLSRLPDGDWRNTVAAWLWFIGEWVGGTVHTFLIRQSVRQARAAAGYRHTLPYGPYGEATAPPRPSPARTGPTVPAPPPTPPPAQPPYSPPPSPPPAVPPGTPVTPPGPPSPTPQAQWSVPSRPWTPPPAADLGRVGPYPLLARLGEGGQGTVYLARYPDGREVAVKLLRDRIGPDLTLQGAFLREAAAAQRVPPFATARVLDVGVADGVAYIVSEYVPGRSLERMVREEGPLAADTLTRLAIQTAAALSGIHSAGIVHRDFKPSNVLVAADGARVIDFGVAKALEQVTMSSGGPKGTPAYMSPEQITGRPVGPESDVFSWGSTMVFAATGRVAFAAPGFYQTAQLLMHHTPDLSGLPPALYRPVAASLEKDPRNRPTAAELMVALTR